MPLHFWIKLWRGGKTERIEALLDKDNELQEEESLGFRMY
jgi:hypothetical protein